MIAPAVRKVTVTFVGAPPVRQLSRASGVSQVEVEGPLLRCVISGSFQPFLEAMQGHEVVSLESIELRK
jgi:ABC-2 type transport system ATP-binding protein